MNSSRVKFNRLRHPYESYLSSTSSSHISLNRCDHDLYSFILFKKFNAFEDNSMRNNYFNGFQGDYKV